MSIWKQKFTLEDLNRESHPHMSPLLGIRFVEVGEDFLSATMPVNSKTMQPFGLLHGGASCVLAETIGSVGANLCLDFADYYAVGMNITASHLRPATGGTVKGKARAVHIGKTTQVWDIEITNDDGKLICLSRLTMGVVPRKN